MEDDSIDMEDDSIDMEYDSIDMEDGSIDMEDNSIDMEDDSIDVGYLSRVRRGAAGARRMRKTGRYIVSKQSVVRRRRGRRQEQEADGEDAMSAF